MIEPTLTVTDQLCIPKKDNLSTDDAASLALSSNNRLKIKGEDNVVREVANIADTALLISIAALRSLTGILPTTAFLISDIGKESLAYYDPSDNSSQDDNIAIFVTADGKRIKRDLSNGLKAKWALKGDGTAEQSANFVNLLNLAKKTGYTIDFGEGRYLFQTFSNYPIDQPMKFKGDSAVLDFGSDKLDGRTIFKLTKSLDIDGLHFVHGGIVFNPSDATDPEVTIIWQIQNCKFEDVYAPVWFINSWSSSHPLNTRFNISWTNNKFINVYFGACFGVIKSDWVNFSYNYCDGVQKQAAFRAGEDDPLDTLNIQNITAIGNTIKNVHAIGTEGDRGTANGIAVFCVSAVISGNHIADITTEYGADNEGIYGKAVDVVIDGNVILRTASRLGEGAINFKGSKRVVVTNNVIDDCFRGMNLSTDEGEVIFANNHVSNFIDVGFHSQQQTNNAIKITGNSFVGTRLNIPVSGNPIKRARAAILYRGWGTQIDISNNLICNVVNEQTINAESVAGIWLSTTTENGQPPASTLTMSGVTIANNRIHNILGTESFGIRVDSSTGNTRIENVKIRNNDFSNAVRGIGIRSSVNALVDGVDIIMNTYRQITVNYYTLEDDLTRITNVYSHTFEADRYIGKFKASVLQAEPTYGSDVALQVTTKASKSGLTVRGPGGTGQTVKFNTYSIDSQGVITEAEGLYIATRGQGTTAAGYVGVGKVPTQALDVKGAIASSAGIFTDGGLKTGYTEISTNLSLSAANNIVNCIGGTITVTLPMLVAGRDYLIINSGTGIVTINAAGGILIDNAASAIINVGEFFWVKAINLKYITVSKKPAVNSKFVAVSNVTDIVNKEFLNTTYNNVDYPAGTVISYFNLGFEYRRIDAINWTRSEVSLMA